MSKIRPIGRMVRRDVSEDEGIARLSDGAARLYFYLTPWLDSWGKFSGGPGTILETVVPLLGWSRKRILTYLAEINTHTSVRAWTQNGRFYVHDERFFEKQEIRDDRRGRDTLPSYPGASRMKTPVSPKRVPEQVRDVLREQVPPEVEVEVEVEGEKEVEAPAGGNGSGAADAPAPAAVAIESLPTEIRGLVIGLRNDVRSGSMPVASAKSILAEQGCVHLGHLLEVGND